MKISVGAMYIMGWPKTTTKTGAEMTLGYPNENQLAEYTSVIIDDKCSVVVMYTTRNPG
jgi:hypothetical protein